jgi:hypothetical protein
MCRWSIVTEWNILGNISPELRDRDDIHYCWREKGSFKTGLDGIYLPMQLAGWLLVEVALLLIGLTKISFVKNWF